MTDEERKKVYLDAWVEANNTPGGRDAHVEGLRAVYNAALTRAAEIARGAQRIAHNESEVRGFEQATALVAAAIDAEKEKS